jgi:hypothetical protein
MGMYPEVKECLSTAGIPKLGRAGLLQVPKSYGVRVYCRYPEVRKNWSTANSKIQGELTYCTYPKVRKSRSTSFTQKLGRNGSQQVSKS